MSEHRPTTRLEVDAFVDDDADAYAVAEHAWSTIRAWVNGLYRPVIVVTMPDGTEHSVDLSEPKHAAAPPLEEVSTWGTQVADETFIVGHPGCCMICGDESNHGGDYCPTGITRQMADWVRVRRENGIGPAAAKR